MPWTTGVRSTPDKSRWSRRRRILIDKPYGRLGNQLYRLANVVAFAMDRDLIVWDRSMRAGGYAPHFPRVHRRLLARYPRSPLLPFSAPGLHATQWLGIQPFRHGPLPVVRNESHAFELSEPALFRSWRRSVVLRGFHFVCDDAVRRHASYLRWLFSPHEEALARARKNAARLGADGAALVAVHLRRTDFDRFRGGRFFVSLDYCRDVMARTRALFADRRVRFLLFSDDPALDLAAFPGLDCVRPGDATSLMDDWLLMSRCDRMLATIYSSYSGWASFYGQVPLFRLNGVDRPTSLGDFVFDPVLNNSPEYTARFEGPPSARA